MVAMGVDKEKLIIQLGRLEEHLIAMEKIKNTFSGNIKEESLFSAERILQLTIEDCLNIGSHIISGKGFRRADTYREIFVILHEEKMISEELSKKMAHLASFRNRLVHLYWEVTPKEIKEKLDNIDIFREYAIQIAKI